MDDIFCKSMKSLKDHVRIHVNSYMYMILIGQVNKTCATGSIIKFIYWKVNFQQKISEIIAFVIKIIFLLEIFMVRKSANFFRWPKYFQ